MKKVIFLTCLCFSFFITNSQPAANNLFPKTITVTGSAEMEIIPDQIYVNVILREYKRKGEDKKELEVIKSDFLKACKTAGIADSAISILSYTGYNSYFWLRKRKKDPDLLASITYQVKFSSSKEMDDLVDNLDDEATQSFDISKTSHSRMTDFRRQLKIQAVKAAKDKATYLTEAIGEKISTAIMVKEPEEPTIIPAKETKYRVENVVGRTMGVNDDVTEINFKKIKLRYEVNVVFALQ